LGAITINSSTTFTRNVAYYIIGQISKFVHSGATRIGVSSSSSSLIASAFLNTNGTMALVSYNSSSLAQSVKIVVGANSFSYSIPGSSACTFSWNNATQAVSELQIEDQKLHITPNPAVNEINLTFPLTVKANIALVSLNGYVLFQQDISNVSESKINTHKLSSGIYLVRLQDEKNSIFSRFIKS